MAAVNEVPQLVDKNRGSYSAIAPKLEPGRFNKWKRRMLCYLNGAGMEPYYLNCIKDGPFQPPNTAEGDDKPESQWTADERRVVVQDQRFKSINMSCLPDDIMESVISWLSPLKVSHRLTLAIRPCSMSFPMMVLTSLNMKSISAISTAFFSNNVIQDFQENSDDEIDERSSEEYLRDLDVEYQERALLANSKRHFARDCFSKTSNLSYQSPVNNFSSVSKGFQPKFTPKLIQSSPNSSSQTNPKIQKDYKAEYKRKKKVLGDELLTESSSKKDENENLFIPASMGILVPESQAVNESLESTKTSNTPESSEDHQAQRNVVGKVDTYFGPGTVDTIKRHLNAQDSNGGVDDAVYVNGTLTEIQ
ncbi:hypothetical protein Tco_1554653 [Tanacetum coccineum]